MRRWLLLLPLVLGVAGTAGAKIVVTDFLGREVRLQEPARRIVALAPHLVENLYTAGGGDKLVGTVSHSDYPPDAEGLPTVGGYTSLSLEAVVALNPDLVIAWASGQGASQTMRQRLESMGIPVYVDQPKQLDDIARAIVDLGRLAGTEAHARRAAADFRKRVAALRERYAGREPVTMLYQVWNDPLQTLSEEHFVGNVIRLCGGSNLFPDTQTLAPKISIEAVLARDPQAIVASGMGASRPDWLDDWREWSGLQAVRNGHLYYVPPDVIQRPTVRIIEGARLLCRKLDLVRGDGD